MGVPGGIRLVFRWVQARWQPEAGPPSSSTAGRAGVWQSPEQHEEEQFKKKPQDWCWFCAVSLCGNLCIESVGNIRSSCVTRCHVFIACVRWFCACVCVWVPCPVFMLLCMNMCMACSVCVFTIMCVAGQRFWP